MKAFICTGYGAAAEVLKLVEMPTPTPKNKETQIKVRAVSVNSGDSRLRRADPFLVRLAFGFRRPKQPILGIVVAGEVSAIGAGVTKFKVGDAIFGLTDFPQLGAFAESVCVDENAPLAQKPQQMSYAEAAALPFGGHTALDFLRKAKIQANQKVLIYGASGAVGTAAVQLAKDWGATVTAVCSTQNVDLVQSLGADAVIDYTKTELTQISERYDVVFDTIGQNSAFDFKNLVTDNGTLILGSMIGRQTFQSIWIQLRKGGKKYVGGTVNVTAADMDYLRQCAERGAFKAVIDKIYPFEAMIEAHNHVDTGRKRGNVIVEIG